MKKVINKKSITASEPVDIITDETTSSQDVKCCAIDKLTLTFGNEDLNKVVEKINEIIEKKCQ